MMTKLFQKNKIVYLEPKDENNYFVSMPYFLIL